jgi:hypothetical protein
MKFKVGQKVRVKRCKPGWESPRFIFYLGREGIVKSIVGQDDPSITVYFNPPVYKDLSGVVSYFESELEPLEFKKPEEWL